MGVIGARTPASWSHPRSGAPRPDNTSRSGNLNGNPSIPLPTHGRCRAIPCHSDRHDDGHGTLPAARRRSPRFPGDGADRTTAGRSNTPSTSMILSSGHMIRRCSAGCVTIRSYRRSVACGGSGSRGCRPSSSTPRRRRSTRWPSCCTPLAVPQTGNWQPVSCSARQVAPTASPSSMKPGTASSVWRANCAPPATTARSGHERPARSHAPPREADQRPDRHQQHKRSIDGYPTRRAPPRQALVVAASAHRSPQRPPTGRADRGASHPRRAPTSIRLAGPHPAERLRRSASGLFLERTAVWDHSVDRCVVDPAGVRRIETACRSVTACVRPRLPSSSAARETRGRPWPPPAC